MNSPHELDYLETRLADLVMQLQGLHSVHALAAVCGSIESTLVDEPLAAKARRRRPRSRPNNLANTITVEAQK